MYRDEIIKHVTTDVVKVLDKYDIPHTQEAVAKALQSWWIQ